MSGSFTRRPVPTEIAGALLWFSSLLWFFAQFAAASAWRTPYSLARNYVSDLGATSCGHFPIGSTMEVCSPLHAVMNTSFVTWGAVWFVGGLLFAAAPSLSRAARTGYVLIGVGGIGTAVVGFVPENVDFTVHSGAALLQTCAAAAGLAVLAVRALRHGHRLAGWLTTLVAVASVVGIVATGAAEGTGAFLGVDLGIWERISLWPLPIWLATAGIAHLWRIAANPQPTASPRTVSPLTQALRVQH